MATKKADNKKEADNPIKTLRQEVDALKSERLEVLQQLRMGTNPNVRKPTLIRRQIAQALNPFAPIGNCLPRFQIKRCPQRRVLRWLIHRVDK